MFIEAIYWYSWEDSFAVTDTQRIVLIALGVLLVLGLIVGGTLNYHIGGFIEQVAREEEEARAREDRDRQEPEPKE